MDKKWKRRVGRLDIQTPPPKLKKTRYIDDNGIIRETIHDGTFSPIQEPEELNFLMPNGGTISLNKNGNPTVVELEYSLDRGETWTIWQRAANGNRSLTLSAGQKVYIRNTSETQTNFSTATNNFYNFAFTGTVAAYGNVNSLLCRNADIVTTLSTYCYCYMFNNCTSLTTAPELPATTLANDCYYYMFGGCTSLMTAPELPATTLTNDCYQYMFGGCTSLMTAPELPATILAENCYYTMFRDCVSLVTAPKLPATTLAQNCYGYMFQGCTSLTAAPKLPATTLAQKCYYAMFYNCTSLTKAPELPATTLAAYCYFVMFNGCTSLMEIRTRMTNITASDCLGSWVVGVAATGNFYCPAELNIRTGGSGIPSGWTRHNI